MKGKSPLFILSKNDNFHPSRSDPSALCMEEFTLDKETVENLHTFNGTNSVGMFV